MESLKRDQDTKRRSWDRETEDIAVGHRTVKEGSGLQLPEKPED